MKVPKDQGLVLGIFYSISLAVILLTWMLLPPTISHEEEDEDRVKILKPEEAILSAEEILTQAEEILAQKEKAEEEKARAGKAKSSKTEDKK
ncbi:MAG: hypothetical protein ACREIQ_12165 [Nitrospiria bacterium]